ncbi:hypothetical protein HPB48_018084 [Haemaphysalis longicornis]|uniref:Uncharacterized protein n=1 Tax=Haemaphysalis longicornis TaxID=44386 RepID=A0A9J6FTQ5_HAELO|nr:hypothetical protein HPB48_018084 [Haemaphysalis longicornis]
MVQQFHRLARGVRRAVPTRPHTGTLPGGGVRVRTETFHAVARHSRPPIKTQLEVQKQCEIRNKKVPGARRGHCEHRERGTSEDKRGIVRKRSADENFTSGTSEKKKPGEERGEGEQKERLLPCEGTHSNHDAGATTMWPRRQSRKNGKEAKRGLSSLGRIITFSEWYYETKAARHRHAENGQQQQARRKATMSEEQRGEVRVTKPVTRRRTKGDHTAQRTALAERADFQDNAIFTDAAWDPDTFRGAVAAVRGQQRDAQAFQYCQEQPSYQATRRDRGGSSRPDSEVLLMPTFTTRFDQIRGAGPTTAGAECSALERGKKNPAMPPGQLSVECAKKTTCSCRKDRELEKRVTTKRGRGGRG